MLSCTTLMLYSSLSLKLIKSLASLHLSTWHGNCSERALTGDRVTIWYRSPELLYGAREYGVGVDIWAAGCMFGEMLLRKTMFRGSDELDQLGKIFTVLGTPTKEHWPHASELSGYVEFTETKPIPWAEVDCFRSIPADTVDLLSKTLELNPTTRIDAESALRHTYFTTAQPTALTPSQLAQSIVITKTSTGIGANKESITTIKVQAA